MTDRWKVACAFFAIVFMCMPSCSELLMTKHHMSSRGCNVWIRPSERREEKALEALVYGRLQAARSGCPSVNNGRGLPDEARRKVECGPLRLRGGWADEELLGPFAKDTMHFPDIGNQEVDEEMQAWMKTSETANIHPRLLQVWCRVKLRHIASE
jgi:hypothetical protein